MYDGSRADQVFNRGSEGLLFLPALSRGDDTDAGPVTLQNAGKGRCVPEATRECRRIAGRQGERRPFGRGQDQGAIARNRGSGPGLFFAGDSPQVPVQLVRFVPEVIDVPGYRRQQDDYLTQFSTQFVQCRVDLLRFCVSHEFSPTRC